MNAAEFAVFVASTLVEHPHSKVRAFNPVGARVLVECEDDNRLLLVEITDLGVAR